jgi:uncharacterized protein
MRHERYEWDDRKARTNLRDHGVSFENAVQVFDDPLAVDDIDMSMDYGEERSIVIGMAGTQILVVIYTMRGVRVRIISARRPERYEHDRYIRESQQA